MCTYNWWWVLHTEIKHWVSCAVSIATTALVSQASLSAQVNTCCSVVNSRRPLVRRVNFDEHIGMLRKHARI